MRTGILLILLILAGCSPFREDGGQESGSDPETRALAEQEPSANPDAPDGILAEILAQPITIRAKEPVEFGRKWVEAMYRHGNVAAAMDAMYWTHPRCRVGVFPCEELDSRARRVGALVAMIPSRSLRPTGMREDAFQERIAGTVRELVPAPDKALPYEVRRGEALLRFLDHHGMVRHLVLKEAKKSWRVIAFGRLGGPDE